MVGALAGTFVDGSLLGALVVLGTAVGNLGGACSSP